MHWCCLANLLASNPAMCIDHTRMALRSFIGHHPPCVYHLLTRTWPDLPGLYPLICVLQVIKNRNGMARFVWSQNFPLLVPSEKVYLIGNTSALITAHLFTVTMVKSTCFCVGVLHVVISGRQKVDTRGGNRFHFVQKYPWHCEWPMVLTLPC